MFIRKEGTAAGGLGNPLQNLVSTEDQPAVIRRDGVNDYLRALRHFDCLRLGVLTLIIFAVAHHHNRAPRRTVFMILHQIVAASPINRVIQSRSSTVLHTVYRRGEQHGIVREALHHLAMAVEGDDKSLIEIRPDGVLQKTNCRILFEVEPSTHRSAGINQEPKLDGKVSLPPEIHNRLRRLMIV